MIRTLTAILIALGSFQFASAQSPDSTPPPQHATSASSGSTHIPSSGLTMEMLQSLPPRYNQWSGYQPTYLSTGPFFRMGYPYSMYGFRPYGMAGYYPPGAGGRYRSSIGLLFWW
jgi:hypothetical protein